MDEKKRAKLAVIEKLLALANDPGASEAESELAMKRAKEMMVKHHIEMTDVDAKKDKAKTVDIYEATVRVDVDTFFMGKFSDWERTLAGRLCRVFGCRHVGLPSYKVTANYRRVRDYSKYQVAIIGDPDNVAMVLHFYDYLQNEAGRASEIYASSQKDQMAFAAGFCTRACERLAELYEQVYADLPEDAMALVVVNQDLAEKRVNAEFGALTTVSAAQIRNGKAFNDGSMAGDSLHLMSPRQQVRKGA